MSKAKVHQLTIRNRKAAKGAVSHGAVTEVLLDGRKLKGITSFAYKVEAGSIGKVTLELIARMNLECNLPKRCIVATKKEI